MKGYRRLTRKDRITIERMLKQGKTQIEIAELLGFHRSSISRELRRNKALHGPYRWRGAHAKATRVMPHPALGYRRKIEGALEELVSQLLEERLSPEQISRRLKHERAKWRVSHETIYKWVYKVSPGHKQCLRWKSKVRQKRGGKRRRGLHKYPRKLIDIRPINADLRKQKGHWERDLLEGQRGGPSLLVIQDRKTRLTLIKKVPSRHCDVVNRATIDALRKETVRSITNDNGVEFGEYEELESALRTSVFYCHAYTSWERGTVENTNGLLRQYFPKGIDFSTVSEQRIKAVESVINSRPKKTLGFKSPVEIHRNCRLQLIKSEAYYRKHFWKRERQYFKQDMLRENGMFNNINY